MSLAYGAYINYGSVHFRHSIVPLCNVNLSTFYLFPISRTPPNRPNASVGP